MRTYTAAAFQHCAQPLPPPKQHPPNQATASSCSCGFVPSCGSWLCAWSLAHTPALHLCACLQVTELAPLALLPISLVDRQVLQPMRLHVGGTILAAALAITQGWAINLGGGMHHAHSADGSGWCPYADITLAIHRLRWERAVGLLFGCCRAC
jgi:hypothetical protein